MRPNRRAVILTVTLIFLAWPPQARAADFEPDPRSVQWYGPAYRYPQDGWIVVHIEGEPHERGVQHGRLLAPEIAAHVRCLAAHSNPRVPAVAWGHVRDTVNSLFLRGYTREQLEEMTGIAAGASAAGARFSGRPLDLLDIAAVNAPNELESLKSALNATPIGLEGVNLSPDVARPKPPAPPGTPYRRRPMRCSAFAATGPATRDGKLVFGHITMWELYPANFYNIWLDIKPTRGHRFVMQCVPGGMHSAMDYIMSESGLLMCETTVEQTGLNLKGKPLASRVRQATQYAGTIEEAAEILTTDGNGLSTAEWLLADRKTDEIALLTLGTHQSKLYRSSKGEWVAGAAGFYWSCNNTKDREVRLETVPSLGDRPSPAAVFAPSKRDTVWLGMYDRHKGAIDADFARLVLTTPALVAAPSLDAKYTTSGLAGGWKTWAVFGPSVGPSWQPTFAERRDFPEVRPLAGNRWTVLRPGPPARGRAASKPALDLHNPEGTVLSPPPKKEPELVTTTAWHGTLLPKSDAEIWLTTGFANYERHVALEEALRRQSHTGRLGPDELENLGVSLFYYRSLYELGARAGGDVPLSKTRSNPRDVHWYSVATGKGVLLLHTLRGLLGEKAFDRLMDEFGREYAGKEVTVAQFRAHVEKRAGKDLGDFFGPWLDRTGLPRLELGGVEPRPGRGEWATAVTVGLDRPGAGVAVPVTVETDVDETTQVARLETGRQSLALGTQDRPVRVVADKYGLAARSNGGPFTILTFEGEPEQTLIVYGTRDEVATNREAAGLLQRALRRREHNIEVPIKSDRDATADDLKGHHLVLIGRPDSNALVDRFRDRLPVTFGPRSFEARGEIYAHPGSLVLAAAENPLNRRYSLVVIAGLSGLATIQTVPLFEDDSFSYAEVVVLPFNQDERAFVVAPKELIRELPPGQPAR